MLKDRQKALPGTEFEDGLEDRPDACVRFAEQTDTFVCFSIRRWCWIILLLLLGLLGLLVAYIVADGNSQAGQSNVHTYQTVNIFGEGAVRIPDPSNSSRCVLKNVSAMSYDEMYGTVHNDLGALSQDAQIYLTTSGSTLSEYYDNNNVIVEGHSVTVDQTKSITLDTTCDNLETALTALQPPSSRSRKLQDFGPLYFFTSVNTGHLVITGTTSRIGYTNACLEGQVMEPGTSCTCHAGARTWGGLATCHSMIGTRTVTCLAGPVVWDSTNLLRCGDFVPPENNCFCQSSNCHTDRLDPSTTGYRSETTCRGVCAARSCVWDNPSQATCNRLDQSVTLGAAFNCGAFTSPSLCESAFDVHTADLRMCAMSGDGICTTSSFTAKQWCDGWPDVEQ